MSDEADKTQRPERRRGLAYAIGAVLFGQRKLDEVVARRFKKARNRFLAWLSGGGLAIYIVVRGGAVAEEWLKHEWQSQAHDWQAEARLVRALEGVAVKMEALTDTLNERELRQAERDALLREAIYEISRPRSRSSRSAQPMPGAALPAPTVTKPVMEGRP